MCIADISYYTISVAQELGYKLQIVFSFLKFVISFVCSIEYIGYYILVWTTGVKMLSSYSWVKKMKVVFACTWKWFIAMFPLFVNRLFTILLLMQRFFPFTVSNFKHSVRMNCIPNCPFISSYIWIWFHCGTKTRHAQMVDFSGFARLHGIAMS